MHTKSTKPTGSSVFDNILIVENSFFNKDNIVFSHTTFNVSFIVKVDFIISYISMYTVSCSYRLTVTGELLCTRTKKNKTNKVWNLIRDSILWLASRFDFSWGDLVYREDNMRWYEATDQHIWGENYGNMEAFSLLLYLCTLPNICNTPAKNPITLKPNISILTMFLQLYK